MRKETDVLEGAGDSLDRAPGGAAIVHRLTIESDLAGVGGQNAGQEIEESGLACAVRANQRVDVALRDLHVKFVQRVEATKAFGQPLDRKTNVAAGRITHGWPSSGTAASGAGNRG